MSKYNWKNIKGVGLGIVAFEATEHLANIITELRDVVDYVTIGLQNVSYHGDPIDASDLAEVLKLKDEDKIVDNVLTISLNAKKAAREQEADKRNLLIQDIEDHGCSHAIIIDSDEFYTKNSFLRALVEIDNNDYEITYCQYINYYHDYKHYMVYPFSDGMHVPFVTKTKYRFFFQFDTARNKNIECQDFTLPSDPTRRYVRPYNGYEILDTDFMIGMIDKFDPDKNWKEMVTNLTNRQPMLSFEDIKKHIMKQIILGIKNKSIKTTQLTNKILDRIDDKILRTIRKTYTVSYHVFDWKTVKMHHMSCVRADIRKKFNDWSSKKCFPNYNDLIDKAVDTYNNFDPETEETQTISLLFGTPDHKVWVKPLPKQYIFPKYDIKDRFHYVKQYKKIAVMNMSSTNSDVNLFEKLESTCKETWAKGVVEGKYDNIDYWTVIDTLNASRIDKNNKTIYVKTDPKESNVQQLLDRWLTAFEMLEKEGYHYDWVLRTNTSTWCNIDIINEFLANEHDDSQTYSYKFFSAFWSTFNVYMSGAAMIWSTRNIRILDEIVKKTDKNFLDLALDDVMMCALWRQRSEKIQLTDPNANMHSFEGTYLPDLDSNTDYDNIDLTCPMFQIKTFQDENGTYENDTTHVNRINNDIVKMKKLNDLWESNKDKFNIEDLARDLKNNMDKTVSILPYSKVEWLSGNITPKEKTLSVIDSEHPYNDETLSWLKDKARECGYIK